MMTKMETETAINLFLSLLSLLTLARSLALLLITGLAAFLLFPLVSARALGIVWVPI